MSEAVRFARDGDFDLVDVAVAAVEVDHDDGLFADGGGVVAGKVGELKVTHASHRQDVVARQRSTKERRS